MRYLKQSYILVYPSTGKKWKKTAEYIETSKQDKTEVMFVALYWEII